jgi:hypothetical protein
VSVFVQLGRIISTEAFLMILLTFSQTKLCDEVSSDTKNEFPLLHRLMGRYDGLCEIICNLVIKDNLLGNKGRFENITLERLNQTDTHILHHFGFLKKAAAFLFNHYPFNIFSPSTSELSGKNADVFKKKVEQLTPDSYIKFFTFQKTHTGYSSQSHALLIKKINQNTYSFFDPNHGEFSQLDINKLMIAINYTARAWQASHIAFIDGNRYVNSLHQRPGIFSTITNTIKHFFKKLATLFFCGGDSGTPPPPPPAPPPPPTSAEALRALIERANSNGTSPAYVPRSSGTKKTYIEKAYFDKPKNYSQQQGNEVKSERSLLMNRH